jgi:excinuclease ABC subunit C
VSSLPLEPGVYWFLDENDNVLYVGKAKTLRNRVRSYTQYTKLTTKIQQMVKRATQLKYQPLENEFEALLVEAELVRLHQPQYNTLLKDDKTPLYIHITSERYPRILPVRKREVERQQLKGVVLGPFQSAYRVKEVLRIVRRIFTWCNDAGDRTQEELKNNNQTACFYFHLDQCPGACLGLISPEKYHENIQQLLLFLRGKKKTVISDLKHQLKEAADQEKFEQAALLRDRIQLIEQVTQKEHRLKPELTLPTLTGTGRENALLYLRKLLTSYLYVPVTFPLNRIEGYDVSNTSGELASVSQVTFINGQPATDLYRLFNIRTLNTPNDYHMLQEALQRRQNHAEWGKPDLVVIDGGKGQLRAALNVWHWHAPVISIAKDPDRIIIPTQVSKNAKNGQISALYKIIELPNNHPALQLIQHLRNESHRFSKKQHTRRRLKKMFQ